MEYNNRIAVMFTDKKGKIHKDVRGVKQESCAYARLLAELGYHVHEVRDEYANQPLDWKTK